MRPSFSPRRIKVDKDTGRPIFDSKPSPFLPLIQGRSFYESVQALPLDSDEKKKFSCANLLQSVIYGIIVAVVMCPCMIGYCAVVFSNPEFQPYMPQLVKLVFISCVAHQSSMLIFSPLPFAIGQMQDAGLIFLSAMATSILQRLGDQVPIEERIATVVIHLSLSTALVGVALIVTGKLKLANVVHYLPMPVIGGYLGFIGLFTFQAGLSLMTGLHLTGVPSWYQLLDADTLLHVLPGVFSGVSLLVITRRFNHFAVLPTCLILLPTIFYIVCYFTSTSLPAARSLGWVGALSEPINFWECLNLFSIKGVHWDAIIAQFPTWFSMFLVIAFSSSLDIAAIIMGTGATLDYNEQLQTVGKSNLLSGLAGGYTGSYIFSQTLFTFRTQTNSRIVGASLALCEFIIVLLPMSIVAYMPLFFFGSVMVFIGVDLMSTWLVLVYHKVLFREYLVLMFSFVSINVLGPQGGMLVGVICAAVNFVHEYAGISIVKQVSKSSNVVWNAEEHDILAPHHRRIVTVELHGHIFFGSAVNILNHVKKCVVVRPSVRNSVKETSSLLSNNGDNLQTLDGSPAPPESLRTKYLVFDFKHVTGMDATAARSCFLSLKVLCKEYSVYMVYVGLVEDVAFLLRASDVITDGDRHCRVFSDLDQGLEWCETEIIRKVAVEQSDRQRGKSIFGAPRDSLESVLRGILHLSDTYRGLNGLAEYFKLLEFKLDDVVFTFEEASDEFYVLLRGEVTLRTKCRGISTLEDSSETIDTAPSAELLRRVHSGCIFGDLDFYMEHPRALEAIVTSTTGAIVYKINREQMSRLEQKNPRMGMMLQQAILRSAFMSTSDSLSALVV